MSPCEFLDYCSTAVHVRASGLIVGDKDGGLSPVVFRDRAGGLTGISIRRVDLHPAISQTNWSPIAAGVTLKFSSSYDLTGHREHLSDTAFVALFA